MKTKQIITITEKTHAYNDEKLATCCEIEYYIYIVKLLFNELLL